MAASWRGSAGSRPAVPQARSVDSERRVGARARPAHSSVDRRWVVRLALGAGAPVTPVDWESVLGCAIHERCAAVIWLRSAAVIRDAAPQAVHHRWRAEALATATRSSNQLAEVAALAEVLENAGVRPVLMKGQALSQMLYGDPFVRPSFDIDLFVPLADRAIAHETLLAADWRHSEGVAPGESTYLRRGPAHAPSLEVHSALLDDNLLAHLSRPEPQISRLTID